MCRPVNSPKVETHSREMNMGHYDCENDALPHDNGQRIYMSNDQLKHDVEFSLSIQKIGIDLRTKSVDGDAGQIGHK